MRKMDSPYDKRSKQKKNSQQTFVSSTNVEGGISTKNENSYNIEKILEAIPQII